MMNSAPEPAATVPDQNVDALISDITKLLAEAEGMLSESTSHAEEHAELFRERREALEPGFAARYSAVLARIALARRRADVAIRTHPYEATALALGFGILVGASVSRRRPRLS